MLNYNFLATLEKELLERGYDSFSRQDQNDLISLIAKKEELAYSEVTAAYLLEYHKKLKIDTFSELCDTLIVQGFTASNGHVYRTNRDDQLNFIAKNVQLLQKPDIAEIQWKTEDAGYTNHTKEEWLQVFEEGVAHKESYLFKYNNLKQRITDATTDADVLAIAWED